MKRDSRQRSSSSTETGPRVVVGRVGRPHGLRGEVTVVPETDYEGRYAPGARFLTDQGEALVVAAARSSKQGGLIVAFGEVEDRQGAERLRGALLTIASSERRSLEPDEFWPEDLEGLEVRDPSGAHLGTVAGVVVGSAQDRLVVAMEGGDRVEVPFVPELVTAVRVEEGYLVVEAPEGLWYQRFLRVTPRAPGRRLLRCRPEGIPLPRRAGGSRRGRRAGPLRTLPRCGPSRWRW